MTMNLDFFLCKMNTTFCDTTNLSELFNAVNGFTFICKVFNIYRAYNKCLLLKLLLLVTIKIIAKKLKRCRNVIDRAHCGQLQKCSEILQSLFSLNFCFLVPSVILKEWSAYKGKSPQTPELVSALTFREWTCPNLKKLWLGKAVEDKNRRMRAFLACMKSDTPSMLNPANVPTHLLLMCCVLR